MRYAAFLRGINVGGRKAVTMDMLRAAFRDMGFEEVRTVQASGNVVFEAGGEEGLPGLADKITDGLENALGYRLDVIVRPLAYLEGLVAADPFHGVAINPATRLYVTFLSGPAENGTEIGSEERLKLVALTQGEVLTAIDLAPGWGTTELMAWLERRFGKGVTTRNWNTILKIAGV